METSQNLSRKFSRWRDSQWYGVRRWSRQESSDGKRGVTEEEFISVCWSDSRLEE